MMWDTFAVIGILAVGAAILMLGLAWLIARDQARIRKLPPDPSAATTDYLRRVALHRVGLDPDDPEYEEVA